MANMKKLTRDYGEIIWTGKKCIMGMHSHGNQAYHPSWTS